MAAKGVIVYARTDFDCLQCGTTLKAGERKPNQTLCSTGRNTKMLSRCQVIWHDKKKQIKKQIKKQELLCIICDVCRKKIKPETPLQVRCISGIKGVLSECQIKARNRIALDRYKAEAEKIEEEKIEAKKAEAALKKKLCLKCNEKFKSKGDYNRICDPCAAVNDRVVRKMHRVVVC